jgi:hypothetical protein
MSSGDKVDWESKLAELAPDARKRVEEVLKKGIEAELTSEATSDLARAAEFSRGWFFSRRMEPTVQEEEMLRGTLAMDDEGFTKFAERLAQLKKLKDS